MPNENNQNGLVFFLGAGASVKAGVPDTRKFIFGEKEKDGVSGFLGWLEEKNKKKELEILEIILNILQERNEIIDVELVLGVVSDLNNKEQFPIVDFFNGQSYRFKSKGDSDILEKLELDLKKFIREKVVVSMDKIGYLDPLTGFTKPINIFSVNYDTCIEMLSRKHELIYTDGFELYWDPKHFDEDFDIKLFKLHGSIIWYLTDQDNYVKLPVTMDEIPLITDEKAKPYISYPIGRKMEFREPLEYLSTELRNYLKKANICLVVGYSFRDDNIRQIFFESAKENKELTIVLVSPHAGMLFKEKLKHLEGKEKNLSSLSDRVICLNYPFENILKNYRLYRYCRYRIPRIKQYYRSAIDSRPEGGDQYLNDFRGGVHLASEVGDIVTVEKILEKELGVSFPDFGGFFNENERFRLLYSMAIFYLLNDDEKGKNYFLELRNTLQDALNVGERFFELHLELSKTEVDNDKSRLRDSIKTFEKDNVSKDFYKWSSTGTNLKNELSKFVEFTKSQRELRGDNDDILGQFDDTLSACQTFIDIFDIQFKHDKYEDAEEVVIGSTHIEIQRKTDLESALENLINSINEFINLI